MNSLYIFFVLIFLYFLYKKYYKKDLPQDLTQDLTQDFDNNLIKINNTNYELDTYSINNILNELNNDINI
jgi:hypothetical protein